MRVESEQKQTGHLISLQVVLRAMLLRISDDKHILFSRPIISYPTLGRWGFSRGNFGHSMMHMRTEDLPLCASCLSSTRTTRSGNENGCKGRSLRLSFLTGESNCGIFPCLICPLIILGRRSQSFRGARQPISLPESLTAAVNELSRREGATQFMTLLAAFQVLLYRYSGQEDVVDWFTDCQS